MELTRTGWRNAGPGAYPGRILSVGELAQLIRETVEAGFDELWVAGEISNVRRPPSGHLYFTLKDRTAQLAAVMFRSAVATLPFEPADGMEVIVRARVGFYTARGDLQLYVQAVEPRGLGALRLAFEQLKEKLDKEGLFSAERKRPIPLRPRRVGIVTALGGAAIHDLLVTMHRRCPALEVVVRPVRVQGAGAAAEIADGIADLNRFGGIDVLIVGRGGGSLEDLWAFNEENVARAIAASRVPVVSAVGHEIDYTIADFVADRRAATPTAAAQLVVPDMAELGERIRAAERALVHALRRRVESGRAVLGRLSHALGHPGRRLAELGLRVDELSDRAARAVRRNLCWRERELAAWSGRLERAVPKPRAECQRVAAAAGRLEAALGARRERAREDLRLWSAKLHALSPLACLERGYAIVRRRAGGPAGEGPIVRDASTLGVGDRLRIRFARGRAGVVVEETEG